ncbi:hypothetical protein J5X07_04450 [Actinomyces bowdenii]|uniref:hypothetical protein n=1 Tax=Actinomyces bowdenii TaxID=131109 RepID=UPI001ABC8010|nr:hypothetical protein [Actinomyces bowdenii]MBO3724281.1 hypothetical protein [Actinomyces bowdenii]
MSTNLTPMILVTKNTGPRGWELLQDAALTARDQGGVRGFALTTGGPIQVTSVALDSNDEALQVRASDDAGADLDLRTVYELRLWLQQKRGTDDPRGVEWRWVRGCSGVRMSIHRPVGDSTDELGEPHLAREVSFVSRTGAALGGYELFRIGDYGNVEYVDTIMRGEQGYDLKKSIPQQAGKPRGK